MGVGNKSVYFPLDRSFSFGGVNDLMGVGRQAHGAAGMIISGPMVGKMNQAGDEPGNTKDKRLKISNLTRNLANIQAK